MLPAKINKKYSNWSSFIPPPNELDEGCIVPEGLFLSIDFFNEKMVFYDHGYDEIYHKTRKELEAERLEQSPHIYCRSTNSRRIDDFLLC